jgi:hypothetical protein
MSSRWRPSDERVGAEPCPTGMFGCMTARRLLVWVLAAVALLATACGGDDEPAKDQGVTRPQYIKQVDALCAKTTRESRSINRRIQALIEGSGSLKRRLRKGAPLLRQTYEKQAAKLAAFKKIEPPQADRAQIAALTTAAQRALDDLRDALPAADQGDVPAIIDLATDASGARTRAERLGVTYGLREDCFGLPVSLG